MGGRERQRERGGRREKGLTQYSGTPPNWMVVEYTNEPFELKCPVFGGVLN